MERTDEQVHQECVQRFIALANEMMKENVSKRVVSAGLMSASCVFATYEVLGKNLGSLNQAAVDSIANSYRRQLEQFQETRKAIDEEQRAKDIEKTVDSVLNFPEDN